MYVWSKQLVIGLLLTLVMLEGIFFWMAGGGGESQLYVRTTQWITANYVLLMIWIFVWMYDQARVRGKNVWVWLLPYVIFPLPTLAFFILRLQRRVA
jgi:sterol desaturase/sphingolipid hydroxylase (fatty acid hydroxylase superfamily)